MLVLALAPLLTFPFAALHRLETFRWMGLLGALIAFLGIGPSVAGDLGSAVSPVHLLARVAGSACAAEASVLIRSFPRADLSAPTPLA